MRRYGLCRTTIYRWLRAARDGGPDALAARIHPGRAPRLGKAAAVRVRGWVVGSTPADHGLCGTLWTRRLVADLVRERLGIGIGPVAAGRLLRRIGLDPGLPGRAGTSCADGLIFVLDGRGRFLCERLGPSSHGWTRAAARLRQRAGAHAVSWHVAAATAAPPTPRKV
jgi:transposase